MKKLNKLKIITSLLVMSSFMFLFQNQVSTRIVMFGLGADRLVISDSRTHVYNSYMDEYVGSFRDQKNKMTHNTKYQGNGIPALPVLSRNPQDSYVEFAISGRSKAKKSDRSEFKISGTDSDFNNFYYSSFRFKLPKDSGPILSDGVINGVEDDWALIWQCPQIDSENKGNSPPLSLHIENDILSVKTIQDFQPWSSGKPKPDVQNITRIQRDRWYTVLIRYSIGENGSYAIWLDGRRVNNLTTYYNSNKLTDTKRLPIGYSKISHNGRQYCTVRYGLYKNTAVGNYRVLFSDFSFGNVYHRLQDVN